MWLIDWILGRPPIIGAEYTAKVDPDNPFGRGQYNKIVTGVKDGYVRWKFYEFKDEGYDDHVVGLREFIFWHRLSRFSEHAKATDVAGAAGLGQDN